MRWAAGILLLLIVVIGGLSPLIPLLLERRHWKVLMRAKHRMPKEWR